MAGFNINDLLNAKSKGAAVQAEGPAEQEQEFKVTMLDVEDLMPSKDNFYSAHAHARTGRHAPHTAPQADAGTRHGRRGCVGTVSRLNGVRVP